MCDSLEPCNRNKILWQHSHQYLFGLQVVLSEKVVLCGSGGYRKVAGMCVLGAGLSFVTS